MHSNMLDLGELLKELQIRAQQVVEERGKVEALFSSIGDGVIVTDPEGKISRVNKVAEDLLGFSEKELLGMWFPKAIVAMTEDGKIIPPMERSIMRAFLTGKPVSERAFYKTKSNKKLPVYTSVSPTILNGKPIGAIELFRDISYEHEVDRMKSEFISIASHQLRTPLSAISTYTRMLSDGYAGELAKPQQKFIEVVLASVDRMNELINTLLDISRIEAGSMSMNPIPTDLIKAIQSIIEESKEEAIVKEIDIKFNTGRKSINVIVDPLLFKEVVANFLSNAIKYTPARGTVEISINKEAGAVTLTVKDSGYGIPKKFHSQIFSKFFRSPNITSVESHGTGLGLYLVRLIAETMGGKVWFKSTEGKGSSFFFSLPERLQS